MEMRETAVLDLPVSRVWRALNDPDILKLCVPGCEEIKVIDTTNYTAKATIKVGFISSKFDNILVKKIKSVENELLAFEMTGEDRNKIGSFKQNLEIKMSPAGSSENHQTSIEIKANVDLKGKFATLGKRIVEWKAKKVTEEFVENLRKIAE
ncbi:MAG: CoxG family protein [Nitrososphaerales archaeon]